MLQSLVAIVAFIPAAACTGYLAAWFSDLYGFRRRSIVERIFWSIPLSIAVSTISAVLLAWATSLFVVVLFFEASAVLCLATITWEWRKNRLAQTKWITGWNPFGAISLFLAFVWIAVILSSLIDFQYERQLFVNIAIFDLGARANWIDSILRNGVPPLNPIFMYMHPVAMRNYYFWYVICASVARMAHVPSRPSLIASCIWSGFALASVTGLYLKHFLAAGAQLRRQFLTAMLLLSVCGLDILVHTWTFVYAHAALFDKAGVWPEINSWYLTLLQAPHHIAGLVCCMLAFLLAWLDGKHGQRRPATTVFLIGLAFASAFGLSVYVGLAFFLLMIAWGLWQIVIERQYRSPLLLIAGGAFSGLLLAPYLWNLSHIPSGIQGGSSPFGIAIRETFPPENLLSTHLLHHLASASPNGARSLANLILLAPGLAVELGFFLAIFLLYLIPALRSGKRLDPARRTIVFIAAASILLSSLMKSSVLLYNDFGFRAALFAQFSLLLFGAEAISTWRAAQVPSDSPLGSGNIAGYAPYWLRSLTTFALIIGVLSTAYYATMFRFVAPIIEAKHRRLVHDPVIGNLSHDAYIAYLGYNRLNASIPLDAVVQFNPSSLKPYYWSVVNQAFINRQTAIVSDKPWCGAELGGDPKGCLVMAAPIGSLYETASAEQARATCRQFGIQYLVATIYDQPWNDPTGWVWKLKPVVQDDEFRAMDCRP